MPIDVPFTNLRVFVAPKVATTSLKKFCLSLVSAPWANKPVEAKSQDHRPHKLLPNKEFSLSQFEVDKIPIALVRQPIGRFLSIYENKVKNATGFHAREWSLAEKEGHAKPKDAYEFLLDLERFSEICPGVGRHAAPQVRWVGESPHIFARVFHSENISQLEAFLSSHLGFNVCLPQENMSAGVNQKVSEALEELIKRNYARDYEFLRKVSQS